MARPYVSPEDPALELAAQRAAAELAAAWRRKKSTTPKKRRKPLPHKRVQPAIEMAILALVRKNPKWGRKALGRELRRKGLRVSDTGVGNVLARHNLTKEAQREPFAGQRKHVTGYSEPMARRARIEWDDEV